MGGGRSRGDTRWLGSSPQHRLIPQGIVGRESGTTRCRCLTVTYPIYSIHFVMRPPRTWESVLDRLHQRRHLDHRTRLLLPVEREALVRLIQLIQSESPGYGFEEFAEALGCTLANVDQFFVGKHGVSLANLQSYCNVLGVRPVVEYVRVYRTPKEKE
jgi:hypothetical protein